MFDLNFYKDKRVFVTGHTGFKGSWLCKLLINSGAIVTGYSLGLPTEPALFQMAGIESKMCSVIGDIRDYNSLKKAFEEAEPEIVFHLAAQPIVRESYSKEYGSGLYADGIFLQLMVEINRMAKRKNAQWQEGEKSSNLVKKVLEYIAEHFTEPLSLQELAQMFYVSKYHLSHEFSREVGTSVYRYIMLKRLLHARQMLSDGAAPGEVFSSCGFTDYANFYRAFKAEYGVSPKDCSGS